MFGLKPDYCTVPLPDKYHSREDYEGGIARWCPGCGGHTILNAVQRMCKDKQLPPEQTVFVSGIGCSSRFPHYMKTYGFHGLHGRALPVASGIKFRIPELDVFVITGDGDCCSIGAGHWVHGIRYNMDMVVLLFDNAIYGLTKNQTSPTSAKGTISNTHPKGSVLPPVNPLLSTLGFANVSFVAQTVDWNPSHLYKTIEKAHEHQGLSFVRIIQRCPIWMKGLYDSAMKDPEALTLLQHENGVQMDENEIKSFKNIVEHDPGNMNKAREFASEEDKIYIGLFYQNKKAYRYDEYGAHNLGMTAEEKLSAVNKALDKYAV